MSLVFLLCLALRCGFFTTVLRRVRRSGRSRLRGGAVWWCRADRPAPAGSHEPSRQRKTRGLLSVRHLQCRLEGKISPTLQPLIAPPHLQSRKAAAAAAMISGASPVGDTFRGTLRL